MAPVMLSSPLALGGCTLKNRICIPPMVLYGQPVAGGRVTENHVRHYETLAEGAPGLIIQEATCVSAGGRLSPGQLGIWQEEQLPGLRKIVKAVHRHHVPIFVQLHHAGIMSTDMPRLCPSSYTMMRNGEPVEGVRLEQPQIRQIRDDFIAAGRRAYEAGYDGVELHGCHSYLLCQFLNRRVNRREDQYGDGLVLIREIFQGIRQVTPPGFVIGIRLGAFEPTLADGIRHARAFRDMGMDFLDVSYGFSGEMEQTAPGAEKLLPVIRGAAAIRQEVDIPVFAVDGIRTPAQAMEILRETGVEMVDIGRSVLVDPNWPKKAIAGQNPGKCLGCWACMWRIDKNKCPGRILLARGEGKEQE